MSRRRGTMERALILLTLFIIGIKSAISADLNIKTTPEKAVVYIRKPAESKRAKLGETTLKVNIEDIFANYSTERTFIIEIEKDGHKDYNLLTSIYNKADINFDVKMEVSEDVRLTKNFDAIVSQLFEAQRLIRDKNYSAAIENLKELTRDHGNLSTVYEMLGSAYYLNKDFQNALSSYRKAFSLNAENSDAYSLKLYLEKALGVRSVK